MPEGNRQEAMHLILSRGSSKNILEELNKFYEFLGLQIRGPLVPDIEIEEPEPELKVAPKFIKTKFLLKRIKVTKSHILTKEEIRAITSKYEKKYLKVSRLHRITRDFNALYKKKKIITSRAIFPPQKIRKGVVKIKLIEGRIGKVIFRGDHYTLKAYILWILDLRENQVVDLKVLEEKLILFNKIANAPRVSISLKPADKFGKLDIVVKVKEVPRLGGKIFFDNKGTESVGRLRYGMTLQDNSLIGFDDQLIVSGTKTESSLSGFASYDFPFTPIGSRVRLLYSRGKQTISGGAFSSLDIEGGSHYHSVKASHPLVVSRGWKIDGDGEYSRNFSETDVILNFQTTVIKYTSGVSGRKDGWKGVWIGDIHAHRILKKEATSADVVPDRRQWYSKFTVGLNRYQALFPRLILLLKLRGQYTPHEDFPITELLQLGGENNRAYSASEFMGDKGYSTEVEWIYSTPWEWRWAFLGTSFGNVKISSFLQYGRVFSSDKKDFATSAGVGLKGAVSPYINIELTWSHGLDGIHRERRRQSFLLFNVVGAF